MLIGWVVACGKRAEPNAPPARVVDLTTLDELRRELEAHRNEPRVLALVAPT
ncbi:MAG: hypothetical protein AB7R00_04740 [Kofleriaceae bacterium]